MPTCHCLSSACDTTITSPTGGPRGIGAAFFSIEFGEDTLDASGSLVNARAYGEYRFTDRFGAGFAIDAFKLDVEASKNRWTGEYVLDYWGPQLTSPDDFSPKGDAPL